MNTEIPPPEIQEVKITDDALTFDLLDGRSISVPLTFYPTLMAISNASDWRCDLAAFRAGRLMAGSPDKVSRAALSLLQR